MKYKIFTKLVYDNELDVCHEEKCTLPVSLSLSTHINDLNVENSRLLMEKGNTYGIISYYQSEEDKTYNAKI